jgi:hypothetical protein
VRVFLCCLLAALAMCLQGERAATQEKQIEVQRVSHAQLKQAVLKQRGKVLVVDFWGEF